MPQSMSTSSRNDVVVFVHGFGSNPMCWDPLLKLLRTDRRITDRFDPVCFQYPTSWATLHPLRRLPRITEIAEALGAFLNSPRLAPYAEVTLVGHSQGGLVIQGYLADRVRKGRARDLARIRQAILIATPSRGSTLLSPMRRLLSSVIDNPQERALRVLDPDTDEIVRTVAAQVVDANTRDDHCWPVPITCFWGIEDRVVLDGSARVPADLHNAFPLDGDHFSVLQPEHHQDPRYDHVADALLDPTGHRCVYEIDLYEMTLRLEPQPPGTQIDAAYGVQRRLVSTESLARVTRAVTFSRKNHRLDPFTLRYMTQHQGYIVPTMSHPNEATPQEAARWEDNGTEAVFRFTPKGGERFSLHVDVYGGFDKGQRDVHLHLGTDNYYHRLRLRLDLTAYLVAGWRVSQGPNLYAHPHDPKDHKVCQQRVLTNPTPATAVHEGCWEWELSKVKDGVVDLAWDVEEPQALNIGYAGIA